MIRPIDIRLNAAHPELPLAEAVTFTGAPSTVLVRGVPPNCGRWAITAVSVAATYPDGSTTTRSAAQSANGVWVATLPATATSGRTANGVRVMADGIDENGEAVTGYVLGVADFAVASLGVAPAPEPGETSYQMLYFDEVPSVLRKGDVAKIDGELKFYNGSAWEAFATPPTLDDAVTRTSANGVKSSGIWSAIWGALTALPTGFTSLYDWCMAQLARKASTADATLTERGYSEWVVSPASITYEGQTYQADYYKPQWGSPFGGDTDSWYYVYQNDYPTSLNNSDPGAVSFTYIFGEQTVTATRTALSGYQLGSQSDKPLASEAEAEALRTAVAGKANDADVVHKSGAETIAGSKTFTGSVTAADVSVTGDAEVSGALVVDGAIVSNNVPLAYASDLRYTLTTKTIANGAVTLDDRAINAVVVSSALASLTVNFPTATSGKARDFGLRLTVASGITTAPELVLPQGVTCENADGEAPEIGADGAATILYFTETASGVFLVKGEVLQTITA